MGDASPLFSTHAREDTTASLSVFHLWVLLYPLVLTRLALAEAGSSFFGCGRGFMPAPLCRSDRIASSRVKPNPDSLYEDGLGRTFRNTGALHGWIEHRFAETPHYRTVQLIIFSNAE